MFVESGGNLGYAGGINAGLPSAGSYDAILILNPDLTLAPDAVTRLLRGASTNNRIGAVVPLMLDEDGTTYTSLRREPALTRAIGDALLGSKLRRRPGFCPRSTSPCELSSSARGGLGHWSRPCSFAPRLRVRSGTGTRITSLYSEETDYFRRMRESGGRIRFEPSAVVKHRRGGSGASPSLATLMAVNRVRYVERHHGRSYATMFRAAVVLAEMLRSYEPGHRRTLAFLLNRKRWEELPKAIKPSVQQ